MFNWLAQLSLKSVLTAASVSAAAATGSVVVLNNTNPELLHSLGLSALVLQPQSAAVPALEKTKAEPPKETKVASLPKSETVEEIVPTPEPPAVKPPKFDIMRVEKDGSILVAGSAEPGSNVELVLPDGTVLGSGKAGLEGDFVILPGDRLTPGDYLITLLARTKDGETVVSGQTGIVKVPENGEELLAMISEEGKASRIVAKPETLEPKVVAKVEVPKVEKPKVEEPKPETIAKIEPKTAPDVEPRKEPVPEVEATPKAEEVQIAALPEDETVEPVVETQRVTQTQKAAPETKPAPAEVAKVEEVTKKPTPAEVAKVEETPAKPASTEIVKVVELPAEPAKPEIVKLVEIPQIVVEAVEVEGQQIFVAGEVSRGATVRVYIDNQSIGTTRGTADKRFLISKIFDLSAGQHSVRADVINAQTGEVLSRAEVPLLHEPPAENPVEVPVEPEVEIVAVEKPTIAEEAQAQEVQKVEEVEVALATPKNTVTDVAQLSAVAPVKKQPVDVPKVDEPEAKTAVVQPKVEEKPPLVVETSAVVPAKPVEIVEEPVAVAALAIEPATPAVPAKPAVTEAVTPQVSAKEVSGKKAAIVTIAKTIAPAVIKTGTSVIIKPGDNLWRISRKTYGRGIRYTTIYNANRDQIRNPHRIYIGQIFKIPEKPDEENPGQ